MKAQKLSWLINNSFSLLLGLTALIRRTLCMMFMAFPAAFAGRDELSNNPSNARNRFPKNRSTPSPPREVILPSIALTQALTLIVSWCFNAESHFLLHFCTPRKQLNGFFCWNRNRRPLKWQIKWRINAVLPTMFRINLQRSIKNAVLFLATSLTIYSVFKSTDVLSWMPVSDWLRY